MTQQVRLGDLLGSELEEEFCNFDLTEIQEILSVLSSADPIDLAHAEFYQARALRGADIIIEYLGKIVKTVTYLESKLNSVKSKAALDYKSSDGSRVTSEMRSLAMAIAPEVEVISNALAKAKGSKVMLEKKYDILIKFHHYSKEIAMGLKRTILGYGNAPSDKVPEGYE